MRTTKTVERCCGASQIGNRVVVRAACRRKTIGDAFWDFNGASRKARERPDLFSSKQKERKEIFPQTITLPFSTTETSVGVMLEPHWIINMNDL
jgi:hypothetical protein